MTSQVTQWLLESDEPWTRYRTLVDLLDRPEDAPEVRSARADMLADDRVQRLIAGAAAWPGYALRRHNDARHPLYQLSTLADLGLQADDPGMDAVVGAVLAHQSPEGAFQTVVNVPTSFGGTGQDTWGWAPCDAPTLLYALLVMGLAGDPRVDRAVQHLVGAADPNGWRCRASAEFGKFRGPGRREDPCPISNVYALKALSQLPAMADGPAVRAAVEMLLGHWALRGEKKVYLFGIGTDFRKLKYPFVWYDVLHVTEVLSRFDCARRDPRLREMVQAIAAQAGEDRRYTATSMYTAWKGWSFADKKNPSPWLTFLVLRVLRRLEGWDAAASVVDQASVCRPPADPV